MAHHSSLLFTSHTNTLLQTLWTENKKTERFLKEIFYLHKWQQKREEALWKKRNNGDRQRHSMYGTLVFLMSMLYMWEYNRKVTVEQVVQVEKEYGGHRSSWND